MTTNGTNLTSKILLLLLLNLSLFASIAQVQAIRGEAKAIRNGNEITLKLGDKIESSDTIKTSKKAKLQLRFNDRTIITIGKNSNISMKDYNYDKKNRANNRAKFGIQNGLFKVVTGKIGKMNPQKFTLKTKTTTMGIRGTELTINDQGDKGTVVGCTSGAITVASNATGAKVDIPAGQMTDVKPGSDPAPARAYNPSEMGGADEAITEESTSEEQTDEGATEEESEETTDESATEDDESGDTEESSESNEDEPKESDEATEDDTTDKQDGEPEDEGDPKGDSGDEQAQEDQPDNSDGDAQTGEGDEVGSSDEQATQESTTEEAPAQNDEVSTTDNETPTKQDAQTEVVQKSTPEETTVEQPDIEADATNTIPDDDAMNPELDFDEEALNAQVDVVDTSAIEQTTTQITQNVESSIDTTPPASPTFTIPNIKEVNGSEYLGSNTLYFSGESEAGSDVIITVGGTTYSTTADANGNWSLNITLSTDGAYTFSAYAEDSANNVSSTIDRTITIDTTAPTVTITDATTFSTSTPTLTGTVDDTNATVIVTINGITYTPTVNSDGTWSVTSSELSNGSYTASVTTSDQLGNSGSTIEDSFDVAVANFTSSPLLPDSIDTTGYTQVYGSTTTNETGKTQLQYLEFGYWDNDDSAASVDDVYPFINEIVRTPESVVEGYINNHYTATYTGGFRALVEGSSIDSGSISLNVDFGNSNLTGDITFDTATTYDATINSGSVTSSGISSSDITGSSVTDGTLQGNFYGPGAEEVGGIFELNSSGGSAQGVFGAAGSVSSGN
jgi:hypothetical protein